MNKRTDEINKELGFYEPAKTKLNQKQNPDQPSGRDLFQTPNYAVDLLVPFIPDNIDVLIWEPACGDGKISKRLETHGYRVFSTDIRESPHTEKVLNFLDSNIGYEKNFGTAIITNPPFSLKQKFYEKCREYGLPFALLIPADYSGWVIQVCKDGAEKIIPTRRVDYITPNVLRRIHEGEVWNKLNDKKNCKSLQEYTRNYMQIWVSDLWVHHDLHNYSKIDDVPVDLLARYSSSDFHSMWLTWKFGLGRTETFVELSLKEKKENI